MNCFIGHISALEYWRENDRDPYARKSKARPREGVATKFSEIDTGKLERHGIKRLPLHIEVACLSDRRPSKYLIPHAWNNMAANNYLKIDDGLYVSTPEACLLQLASSFSIISLIELGCELSGTYALSTDAYGGLKRREPRTNPSRISQYLEYAHRIKALDRAKLAARHIIAGSASPMETALAMLLCLPGSLGGYGLPKPQMNYPIEIEPANYWREARIFRCDLCWPEAKVALEYDSDQFHAESEKLNRDSTRRALLEQHGVHVISVTKKQLYEEMELERLAGILAKHLDKRLSKSCKQHRKRFELRKTLLTSK